MSANGIVILGGGLAGLSASVFSGAPVYEASQSLGGVAQSDKTEGFTFDRGIHILQTKSQWVLDYLKSLGVQFEEHVRRAFIYSHGTYTPYPFQVNTAGLPITLRLRCLQGFFGRKKHGKPENYEDWIRANLGDGFADAFLIPYSDKFWTTHPRDMTFEWAGNRVPQPSRLQVLRGAVVNRDTPVGTNAVFRYPVGPDGYGTVANALARQAGPTYTGHAAIEIDPVKRHIRFQNGNLVGYETLLSTIPLNVLIPMCKGVPPRVSAAAARLRTNSIFIVNLGIDRANISSRHWVHFPEKQFSFFRISYPHNFSSGVTPPGTSSISAEVPYSDTRPIDKSAIVERVIQDLIRARALKREDPIVVTTTHDVRHAYCIYDHHRVGALREVHCWLRTVGIPTCGRYGLWTYFWSDEAIMSGKKAAEMLKERVTLESCGDEMPKHFYERFRFCPQCGAPYTLAAFDGPPVVFRCTACQFNFYQNSVPSVVALIPLAGMPNRVLMLSRSTEPCIGKLAPPGGFLEYAEDPKKAVEREVQEETTVEIQVERLIFAHLVDYCYLNAHLSVLELAYLARPVNKDVSKISTVEAQSLYFHEVDELLEQNSLLAFPEHNHILSAYRALIGESSVRLPEPSGAI